MARQVMGENAAIVLLEQNKISFLISHYYRKEVVTQTLKRKLLLLFC